MRFLDRGTNLDTKTHSGGNEESDVLSNRATAFCFRIHFMDWKNVKFIFRIDFSVSACKFSYILIASPQRAELRATAEEEEETDMVFLFVSKAFTSFDADTVLECKTFSSHLISSRQLFIEWLIFRRVKQLIVDAIACVVLEFNVAGLARTRE